MRRAWASLACGLLFGAGLTLSDMINPARVLAFLDVAGDWDPTAAIVFASALLPSVLAYRIAARRPAPVLAPAFQLSARKSVDLRLISGAVIFGIGWGLSGFCPGPVIAALSTAREDIVIFFVAVLAGMGLFSLLPAPARVSGGETGERG